MAGAQTRRSHGGRADTSAGPTRRDELEDRRDRRERDDPLRRAYEAGLRGDDDAEYRVSDELAGYYDDGAAARRRDDRQERIGAATARGGTLANDGAGYVLGILAYALFVQYLGGGTKAVRAWLSAKFINTVSGDAAKPKAPSKPAGPSSAGGGA